jgi:hypothetical protein
MRVVVRGLHGIAILDEIPGPDRGAVALSAAARWTRVSLARGSGRDAEPFDARTGRTP